MGHKFTIELTDKEFDTVKDLTSFFEEVEQMSGGTEVITYSGVIKDCFVTGLIDSTRNILGRQY